MPFKTRRQKIGAMKRRFSFSTEGVVNYQTDQEVEKDTGHQSNLKTKKIETKYDYVRNDLLKIIFLAFGIILIQIILKILNFKPLLFRF